MSVKILRDRVIKRGEPGLMRIEAEKTRVAGEIADCTQLFRVPKVLDFDEHQGVLVMERIPGLRGIRRSPLRGGRWLDAMSRAGAALAAIHDHLALPQDMQHGLPGLLASTVDCVCIHGDFSGENVCTDEEGGSLVIIDWQASPRLGRVATYGSRYFDVCWYIGNIFRKPIYKYVFDPPVSKTVESFLTGYIQGAGANFNATGFCEFQRRLYRYRVEGRGTGELMLFKRLLLAYGFSRWGGFVERCAERESHGLSRIA